ncbi:MAG: mechanosensitive ion channel family protein [Halanaerobiaceae bacterium]
MIFLIGLLIIKLISLFLDNLNKWFKRITISDEINRIVKSKLLPVLYYIVFYVSITRLNLPLLLENIIKYIGFILLVVLSVLLLQKIFIYWLKKYWGKGIEDNDRKQLFDVLILISKIIIWVIAGLILLDNLGIKISGLIAGLGIGGIAIAFSAQAILEDIFSYTIILFDKPFEVGDFVVVGENRGAIEHIGIKTTKIRSLGGEQLILSNKDLINSRINNYKRMQRRRVLFKFGVVYHTPLEKLKKIQGLVREIIDNKDMVDFDRCHFQSFGDSALIYEVVYYVNNREYSVYMDINHEILLEIKEVFKNEGIGFAYPTQSIYMHKVD